jgi:hypothetical protein
MTDVKKSEVQKTLRKNREAVRRAEAQARDLEAGAVRSNKAIDWALTELRRNGLLRNGHSAPPRAA